MVLSTQVDGVVLVLRNPQRPELPLMGLRVDDLLALVIDAAKVQRTRAQVESLQGAILL